MERYLGLLGGLAVAVAAWFLAIVAAFAPRYLGMFTRLFGR